MTTFTQSIKIVLLLSSLTLFQACTTADLTMSNSLTEKGLINNSNVRLGYVWLWDRDTNTIQRVDSIDPTQASRNLAQDSSGFDTTVSYETGATFSGNIDLTAVEISALEVQVSRRSRLVVTNLQNTSIRSAITAMTTALNTDFEQFSASIGLQDAISSKGHQLYVIATEVAFSGSLTFEVDNVTAANTEFSASDIRANLGFRVTDAGQLTFGERGGTLAPTFVRFSILQASIGSDGNVKFKTVTSDIRPEFLELVRVGAF